jgi:effector-binding domain-containing protein
VAARPVALMRGSATWDDGFKTITGALAQIQSEMQKAGLTASGHPFTVFVETDDAGFRYEAMVPLDKAPEGKSELTKDIQIGSSPSGKAMKFQHRGAYDDIDATYEAITAYLDEKNIEAQNLFLEEYLTDPKAADDQSLEVDIYVFIKG